MVNWQELNTLQLACVMLLLNPEGSLFLKHLDKQVAHKIISITQVFIDTRLRLMGGPDTILYSLVLHKRSQRILYGDIMVTTLSTICIIPKLNFNWFNWFNVSKVLFRCFTRSFKFRTFAHSGTVHVTVRQTFCTRPRL
jgi:hypothetical protein